MTEKTTPELPYTLAKDKYGNTLKLDGDDGDFYVQAEHRRNAVAVGIDPAELMRNLAAFVPEVEPVAWLDKLGRYWSKGETGPLRSVSAFDSYDSIEELTRDHGPLTELYAHPPVTAEPTLCFGHLDDDMRLQPCDDPGHKRPVTAEPATAPRFDLVEGLNVEEWAHKADVEHQALRNLSAVLDAAWEALKQHGFTSDTLESQTLAESIHALAGRGAPSVEQIFHALDPHFTGLVSKRAAAEAVHALYGTPGDAGEAISEGDYNAMHERARKAERERNDASARERNWAAQMERAEARVQSLEAEVERCKAALEAAEWLMRATSKHVEAQRDLIAANRGMETTGAERFEAQKAFEATRAAVEAETSEEAGA